MVLELAVSVNMQSDRMQRGLISSLFGLGITAEHGLELRLHNLSGVQSIHQVNRHFCSDPVWPNSCLDQPIINAIHKRHVLLGGPRLLGGFPRDGVRSFHSLLANETALSCGRGCPTATRWHHDRPRPSASTRS